MSAGYLVQLYANNALNYPEYTSMKLPKPDKELPKDAKLKNRLPDPEGHFTEPIGLGDLFYCISFLKGRIPLSLWGPTGMLRKGDTRRAPEQRRDYSERSERSLRT